MVAPDDSGPRAELRYFAGAVGHQGFPGTTAWNTVLGRYWSHRGAQRIVVLPSDPNRAWLLTSEGTFRSFRDVSPVDGIYEEVSPRNEYRALTTIPGGWELRYLDGTVSEFDSAGKWTLNPTPTSTQLWHYVGFGPHPQPTSHRVLGRRSPPCENEARRTDLARREAHNRRVDEQIVMNDSGGFQRKR
jgi:hypothetical protein